MVFFSLFSNNPDILSLAAGKALFREGESDGQAMYVLTSGTAEVYVHDRLVEQLNVGSIVGEMGLVDPAPRSATVIALTPCEFVRIDERRFHFLVEQTPHFAIQVMKVMAERLRRTDALLPPLEST